MSELANLIIRLAVQGGSFVAGMQEAKRGSESFAESFSRTATELRSKVQLAQSTMREFYQAGKEVFEFTEEGAQIRQLGESFARTAVDIEALRQASRNTVADTDLMAQSMTLLAGTSGELRDALTASLPELLEIAKASNKVNPELGETTFLFESLATGVKRGSQLMIDNTGITISASEAYAEYAEKIGLSADALTEEQKKIALLQGTIERGRTLIQQAGGDVDSYTDSWSQLRVAVKNWSDQQRMAIGQAAEPMIRSLAEQITQVNRLTQEYGHAAAARAYFNSTYHRGHRAGEMDLQQMEELRQMRERDIMVLQGMANAQEDVAAITGNSALAFEQYNAAIAGAEPAMAGFIEKNREMQSAMRETATQGDLVRDAIRRIKDALEAIPSRTEIEILQRYRVERAGGLPQFIEDIAGPGASGMQNGGMQAQGGDFVVNRPTAFVAGDAGMERATFTPLTAAGSPRSGGTGADRGRTANFYIYGADDPRAVAQYVYQMMVDHNLMPAQRFR